MGKTVLGIDAAASALLAGKRVGWFTPTYRLLDEAWRTFKELLRPIAVQINEQLHRLELQTGGILETWSLTDGEAGRSRSYGLIIVDDAAMVADLETVWTRSLRPTLADTRGSAFFLSTPRGVGHYFHRLFLQGLNNERADWISFQMPTSSNVMIDPGEIEAARNDLSENAFAQEYEAQFIAGGAGVFRNVSTCIRPASIEVDDMHEYVFGIDWGRSSDSTAVCVLDVTARHGASGGDDRYVHEGHLRRAGRKDQGSRGKVSS